LVCKEREFGILDNMTIQLLTDQYPDRPAFDTALSHALLRRSGAGEVAETLRLHQPGSIVAFGRRDVVSAGYLPAVAASRTAGYEAIERLAGGRAAVFHPGTIAFAWTIPSPAPRETIRPRFEALTSTLLKAFRALGADARVGEVPGEYCPGAYSINVSGLHKVMGTGQRIVGRAAHVGGVIVVEGGDRIAEILIPVYRALELTWNPVTSGDLAGAVPGITRQDVLAAIVTEFDRRYGLEDGRIEEATLALAAALEHHHLSPPG
jgi:lipoate-protein ligase A